MVLEPWLAWLILEFAARTQMATKLQAAGAMFTQAKEWAMKNLLLVLAILVLLMGLFLRWLGWA